MKCSQVPSACGYSALLSILLEKHLANPISHLFSFTSKWSSFSGSLLQHFTAESSREVMSSEKYSWALRKLNNKQGQVVMFLVLLFKLSSQFSFVPFSYLTFSILSLLPFSILSLLFLISPSLSTITSFSSDQFSVLLR